MKNVHLYNVDIPEKFLKDWALNKKYIAEKDDFKISRWPYVTFNDVWSHTLFNKKKCVLIKLALT